MYDESQSSSKNDESSQDEDGYLQSFGPGLKLPSGTISEHQSYEEESSYVNKKRPYIVIDQSQSGMSLPEDENEYTVDSIAQIYRSDDSSSAALRLNPVPIEETSNN